jgi:hypothetical protein
MASHMKTTVQIPDPLLRRAKAIAREEGTTLAALVEEGLRRAVDERARKRVTFTLKECAVGGKGLNPEYEGSWERVREAAYEGRGG